MEALDEIAMVLMKSTNLQTRDFSVDVKMTQAWAEVLKDGFDLLEDEFVGKFAGTLRKLVERVTTTKKTATLRHNVLEDVRNKSKNVRETNAAGFSRLKPAEAG
jgi:hypothetical protein